MQLVQVNGARWRYIMIQRLRFEMTCMNQVPDCVVLISFFRDNIFLLEIIHLNRN